VIAFSDGRATLLETMEGVTLEQVLAATEFELAIAHELAGTSGARTNSGRVPASSMGETV
jgi:acetate CoA/acetoacetate CoA-transferase beta subunit